MKRLPTLTNAQRRALLVIEWVLLIGIVVYSFKAKTSSNSSSKVEKAGQEVSALKGNSEGSLPKEEPFESFPFDPNTADSTTLLRLGLSPWQVRSIYRYRAKHGRYHKVEDFMRLPGLTNEQWERLKPCIRIAKEFQYVQPEPRKSYQEDASPEQLTAEIREIRRDSLPRQEKPESWPTEGRSVDLSTSSRQWKPSSCPIPC